MNSTPIIPDTMLTPKKGQLVPEGCQKVAKQRKMADHINDRPAWTFICTTFLDR
jgi:hypothetical protein